MRLREWTFTIDDSEVEHRVKECQKRVSLCYAGKESK